MNKNHYSFVIRGNFISSPRKKVIEMLERVRSGNR